MNINYFIFLHLYYKMVYYFSMNTNDKKNGCKMKFFTKFVSSIHKNRRGQSISLLCCTLYFPKPFLPCFFIIVEFYSTKSLFFSLCSCMTESTLAPFRIRSYRTPTR